MAGSASADLEADTKRAGEIYGGFCIFLKISIISIIVILALMAMFVV